MADLDHDPARTLPYGSALRLAPSDRVAAFGSGAGGARPCSGARLCRRGRRASVEPTAPEHPLFHARGSAADPGAAAVGELRGSKNSECAYLIGIATS